MIRLKTNTDNLLHSNPELYAVFENDKSFEMARFIHAILQKYETGKKVLAVSYTHLLIAQVEAVLKNWHEKKDNRHD